MKHTVLRILAVGIFAASALPGAAATLTLRDTFRSYVGAKAGVGDALNPILDFEESKGTFQDRTTASASKAVPLAFASASVDARDGTLRGRSSGGMDGGAVGAAVTESRLDYHFDVSGVGPVTLPSGWFQFGFDGEVALNPPFPGTAQIFAKAQVYSRPASVDSFYFVDQLGVFLGKSTLTGSPLPLISGVESVTDLETDLDGNRMRFHALFTAPAITLAPGHELIIQMELSTDAMNALADSSSTAVMAIMLPDTVSLNTDVLGSVAPAWFGRDLNAPAQVPAPPALLLGLSGLVLMFGVARRRRPH